MSSKPSPAQDPRYEETEVRALYRQIVSGWNRAAPMRLPSYSPKMETPSDGMARSSRGEPRLLRSTGRSLTIIAPVRLWGRSEVCAF